MSAPTPAQQDRKTAVLDATFLALRRAPARNISQLYENMLRIIDINYVPALSTFRRWVLQLPLEYRDGYIFLRSFVPSPEFNAYLLTLCDGMPMRVYEEVVRRDLWLDDREGAVWDSLRWAVLEDKFRYQRAFDGLCWLVTPFHQKPDENPLRWLDGLPEGATPALEARHVRL